MRDEKLIFFIYYLTFWKMYRVDYLFLTFKSP